MTEYVEKLMQIDQKLLELLNEQDLLKPMELYNKYEELDFENQSRILLNKMTLKERVESLKRCQALWSFIDIKPYLNKYPLNKKKIKEENSYIEEYLNLRKYCNIIADNIATYKEYRQVIDILQIDDVEDYLLNHMSAEQIYELSKTTNDWYLKMFYFSYINNKKGF